jgi:hypothetical protein
LEVKKIDNAQWAVFVYGIGKILKYLGNLPAAENK